MHNLYEVMRALYTRYYRRNHGFTTADLPNELRTAGIPDVDTFYRRYIDGRDSLPYEAVFAKAGLLFHREVASVPFVGVSTGATQSGAMQGQRSEEKTSELQSHS